MKKTIVINKETGLKAIVSLKLIKPVFEAGEWVYPLERQEKYVASPGAEAKYFVSIEGGIVNPHHMQTVFPYQSLRKAEEMFGKLENWAECVRWKENTPLKKLPPHEEGDNQIRIGNTPVAAWGYWSKKWHYVSFSFPEYA